MNEKLIQEGKDENAKENVPMKVRKETLDYGKKKPAVKTTAKAGVKTKK
jgi:hypothetical protein